MWLYHRDMSPNDAHGMANSVDPDQTAPLGAVWSGSALFPLGAVLSGSALFAQAYLSENLGSLRYFIFQNYLRSWARELEVPILSVDYSLAPDYPFPRALEECFYAYAWALKYPEKLGNKPCLSTCKNNVTSLGPSSVNL